MTSLKDLRNRKKSILATRKITSAMKMIAAAKLKKACENLEKARPYANLMSGMLKDLLAKNGSVQEAHPLLSGKGRQDTHLVVVATSNRGLCGGFNGAIVRQAKTLLEREKVQGRTIKLLCWGLKGRDQLRRDFGSYIMDVLPAVDQPQFQDVAALSRRLQQLFAENAFDMASIIYTQFKSALSQEVKVHRLIPFSPFESLGNMREEKKALDIKGLSWVYEYEPSKGKVLEALLPKNLSVQLFGIILENLASEHGARMAAMDAATRNAEELTRQLDLSYNRTRQALITKELIEIISGAQAL